MDATWAKDGVEEGARRFLFDFDAYERMAEVGVFDKPGRVELIEGVIVDMAPAGMEHARVNSDLLVRLHVAVAAKAIAGFDVVSNATLRIDDRNAPEPDVLVARRPADGKYYRSQDAVLVIEVSVSTQDADRKVKVPLYARAGIPELWIVMPETRSVRVYRGPRADGQWDSEVTAQTEALHPLFAPEIEIALTEIFGR